MYPGVRKEYGRKHLYNMGEIVPVRPQESNSLIVVCLVCLQSSGGGDADIVTSSEYYLEHCMERFREFCLLVDKPGHVRLDMFGQDKLHAVEAIVNKHYPSAKMWIQ